MSTNAIQHEGKSFPLGATLAPGGANFSVFAKHNSAVQLLLFDDVDAPKPSRVIDLDRRTNRTYHYWHMFVPGITAGQIYAYRVVGPFDPERGCASTQNTEISWFDWNLVEKHADIRRFAKALIMFRMNRDLPVERLDVTLNELLHRQPFQWHGSD